MRVLVTGASGFVGQAVIRRLQRDEGVAVRGAFRTLPASAFDGIETSPVGDLGPHTDWRGALVDVDLVVHCAARVHVMHDTEADPLAAYRRSNVEGTLHLARSAVAAGCRRFVFISSIKVNGEATVPGEPFSEASAPAPLDPYGVSKLEAEQGLFALAEETGLEVVVVRPPLVYGPGVKANFRSMMRWLQRGVPLPFGAIDNRRSLVGLDNLADLVVCCATHPAAANQVFLAGDGEDLSTSELLRRVARALGRPARLLPVPAAWMSAAARLVGRQALATRLCGSLQVDTSKARTVLGWQPPDTVDEGLRKTAVDFLARLK
ncbi:SDR family oxidoreductase [Denitromonas sp. IR12]|uniref:SDR family oxidoreductase n=2 Tax=Denitromonas iodatirespirans TaxID=2795389 RepID=A0A944DGB9_DENI1|nr:SDR family oxidoreductase [Denitromonas iodatirespirans]